MALEKQEKEAEEALYMANSRQIDRMKKSPIRTVNEFMNDQIMYE